MNPDSANNNLESLTIDQLACGAQKGDSHCFEKLVYQLSGRLYQFLRYRTGNAQDAEDLLQETFVRIYKHIGHYQPKRNFISWVYTIAVRLSIDHYHNEQRRKTPNEHITTELEPDPAALVEKQELQDNLWQQVRSLPADLHHVLWFMYAEGMTVKEIAAVMDKRQVTVRVLLYRARRAMAEKLTQGNNRHLLPEEYVNRKYQFKPGT